MLSLNKYEHCMFQSQAPRCFVYCSYRGTAILYCRSESESCWQRTNLLFQ